MKEKLKHWVVERRLGRFSIARCMLGSGDLGVLLQNVVVIRCEYLYASDEFDYVGFCEAFEPVPYGGKPFEYRIKYSVVGSADGYVVRHSWVLAQ